VFVLGVDPGLTRCGFGVVERVPDGRLRALRAGVVETPRDAALPDRLVELETELSELVREVHPDAVVVERVFFQVNARTAMAVAQASGIALAVAARAGVEVAQLTANEVKQAVAGTGAASKAEVERMVARTLRLALPIRPADAADALALAMTFATVSYRARATRLGRSVGGGDARGSARAAHSLRTPLRTGTQ
jgi:crossover junction endodeoxyribonuclease RuvC